MNLVSASKIMCTSTFVLFDTVQKGLYDSCTVLKINVCTDLSQILPTESLTCICVGIYACISVPKSSCKVTGNLNATMSCNFTLKFQKLAWPSAKWSQHDRLGKWPQRWLTLISLYVNYWFMFILPPWFLLEVLRAKSLWGRMSAAPLIVK